MEHQHDQNDNVRIEVKYVHNVDNEPLKVSTIVPWITAPLPDASAQTDSDSNDSQ